MQNMQMVLKPMLTMQKVKSNLSWFYFNISFTDFVVG